MEPIPVRDTYYNEKESNAVSNYMLACQLKRHIKQHVLEDKLFYRAIDKVDAFSDSKTNREKANKAIDCFETGDYDKALQLIYKLNRNTNV